MTLPAAVITGKLNDVARNHQDIFEEINASAASHTNNIDTGGFVPQGQRHIYRAEHSMAAGQFTVDDSTSSKKIRILERGGRMVEISRESGHVLYDNLRQHCNDF